MLSAQFRKQRDGFTLEVAFDLPAAGVAALFGPSGCGKSTTVGLLAGLLRADAGRLAFGDEVLFDAARGIDVPAERRGFGVVFQDARLFPHLDVAANLRFGMVRARARAARFAFDDIVALLGVAPLMARRPHELSGGEQQRVALGRALLSQPRLLLLDEPLASLDRPRREELLPYLERVRDGLGVPMVYISHQFEEVARLATRLVLLEAGRVVVAGELGELCLHPALRRAVGTEATGAIVDGRVVARDATSGLAEIAIGAGRIRVDANELSAGQAVRVQLLARDLILATEKPQGLSVRNELPGTVVALEQEDAASVLVTVDVGGPRLLARVTPAAARDLALAPGQRLWTLVKAVTLRGHVFPADRP